MPFDIVSRRTYIIAYLTEQHMNQIFEIEYSVYVLSIANIYLFVLGFYHQL